MALFYLTSSLMKNIPIPSRDEIPDGRFKAAMGPESLETRKLSQEILSRVTPEDREADAEARRIGESVFGLSPWLH